MIRLAALVLAAACTGPSVDLVDVAERIEPAGWTLQSAQHATGPAEVHAQSGYLSSVCSRARRGASNVLVCLHDFGGPARATKAIVELPGPTPERWFTSRGGVVFSLEGTGEFNELAALVTAP